MYRVWQILGIAIARLFSLKKNPFSSGRYAQICLELVAIFLMEVLKHTIQKDLDTVGLKKIKQYLDKYFPSSRVD